VRSRERGGEGGKRKIVEGGATKILNNLLRLYHCDGAKKKTGRKKKKDAARSAHDSVVKGGKRNGPFRELRNALESAAQQGVQKKRAGGRKGPGRLCSIGGRVRKAEIGNKGNPLPPENMAGKKNGIRGRAAQQGSLKEKERKKERGGNLKKIPPRPALSETAATREEEKGTVDIGSLGLSLVKVGKQERLSTGRKGWDGGKMWGRSKRS